MTDRHVTAIGLGLAGVLVGHVLGYGLAELLPWRAPMPDHAHLGPLASVAVAAAGLGFVVAVVRRAAAPLPRPAVLAAVQVALFGLLEFAERGGDLAALVTSPAVWLGLVAQPVVAWLMHRLVGLGIAAIERLAAWVPPPAAPALPQPVVAGIVPVRGRFVLRRWRGPPA